MLQFSEGMHISSQDLLHIEQCATIPPPPPSTVHQKVSIMCTTHQQLLKASWLGPDIQRQLYLLDNANKLLGK